MNTHTPWTVHAQVNSLYIVLDSRRREVCRARHDRADLIAAAPDMLEALLMLRACKRSDDRDAWDDACDAADAAIAKSEPRRYE